MTITIYEYICYNQPLTLYKLYLAGLLIELVIGKEDKLTRMEIISLMRHDSYKRVKGAIRQSIRGV